ncbi:hypothetical protein TI03_04490 [Achromatium sp. WMS1]|nr:hypothetical protein TI03_04490 [Achromatium sp. WMS1]
MPQPKITYVHPNDSWLRSFVIHIIEWSTGRQEIERIYKQLKDDKFDITTFFARGLALGRISWQTNNTQEVMIPRNGPLIFIANHPFGVVDGLMLCDLAVRTRGKFKILINALLCRDADLDPYFLPVDFSEGKEAIKSNLRTKQEALTSLAAGGTLLLFPAGGIATARYAGFGPLEDLPWSTFVARLIHQSQATVVPVFFHGCNSWLFHVVSGVSMTLRLAMLLYEVRNKLGKNFIVTIGNPIPYKSIAHLNRKKLTGYLRDLTWSLKHRFL